jgi:cytochrome c1
VRCAPLALCTRALSSFFFTARVRCLQPATCRTMIHVDCSLLLAHSTLASIRTMYSYCHVCHSVRTVSVDTVVEYSIGYSQMPHKNKKIKIHLHTSHDTLLYRINSTPGLETAMHTAYCSCLDAGAFVPPIDLHRTSPPSDRGRALALTSSTLYSTLYSTAVACTRRIASTLASTARR